jgi:hypothetical protein
LISLLECDVIFTWPHPTKAIEPPEMSRPRLALGLVLSVWLACAYATSAPSLLAGVPRTNRTLGFRQANITSLASGMLSGFTALTTL